MSKPNYGIDAPEVVRRFFIFGVIGLGVAFGLSRGFGTRRPQIVVAITPSIFATSIGLIVSGTVMVWGSKMGKLRLRDRVLDGLKLQGSERVLDVGCGRGLMLIGAARRLPRGQAVGVDLWQTQDQSGNDPDRTRENAASEGVADRIELHTADARKLPFADAAFDAVVSSWAIHNIYDAPGREQAVNEIIRVLKPGGRIVLIDIRHTADYAATLRRSGLTVKRSLPNFLFVIPSHVVTATK
jgi:arsenite methyltransferase